jgi:hypothetical protein
MDDSKTLQGRRRSEGGSGGIKETNSGTGTEAKISAAIIGGGMAEKRDGFINMQDEIQLLELWEKQNMSQIEPGHKGVERKGDCLKCAARNAGLDCQMFEAKLPNGTPIYFSKAIADEKTRGKTPHAIAPSLLRFHVYQNEFEEAHVAHVDQVDIPGIVVFGAISGADGKPALFSYLIDGTHRAMAALRAGREFKAYCLNAKETAFCAEVTKEQISAGGVLLCEPVGGSR